MVYISCDVPDYTSLLEIWKAGCHSKVLEKSQRKEVLDWRKLSPKFIRIRILFMWLLYNILQNSVQGNISFGNAESVIIRRPWRHVPLSTCGVLENSKEKKKFLQWTQQHSPLAYIIIHSHVWDLGQCKNLSNIKAVHGFIAYKNYLFRFRPRFADSLNWIVF